MNTVSQTWRNTAPRLKHPNIGSCFHSTISGILQECVSYFSDYKCVNDGLYFSYLYLITMFASIMAS